MPRYRVIDLADLVEAMEDVAAARSVFREVTDAESIDCAADHLVRAEDRLNRLCRVRQTAA